MQLVIEVDGGYHFEAAQQVKDKERQSVLEDMGLQFLRFDDEQVRKDMDALLRKIEVYIENFEAMRLIRIPCQPASKRPWR